MGEHTKKYRMIMLDLLWARAVRPVSQDEEERFAEEMDEHWLGMSPSERGDNDQWFRNLRKVKEVETLPLWDVDIIKTPTVLPRRQE